MYVRSLPAPYAGKDLAGPLIVKVQSRPFYGLFFSEHILATRLKCVQDLLVRGVGLRHRTQAARSHCKASPLVHRIRSDRTTHIM